MEPSKLTEMLEYTSNQVPVQTHTMAMHTDDMILLLGC
jgi:hypothetical protein